jgi:GNAT superfamily N-acetyltransferase
MQLDRFNDAERFHAVTGDWFARDEYRNALAISFLASAIQSSTEFSGWVVRDDRGMRAAIFQTVPTLLCLAGADPEAVVWAAGELQADFANVTGVAETVEPFVKRWAELHHRTPMLHHSMTFYALEKLESFADPGGVLRVAMPEERDEVVHLAVAGAEEMTDIERAPDVVAQRVGRAIAEGRQYVWADGSQIRAIAMYSRSLPDCGARISMVYTAPEFRGRGYGAAITGSLARLLLESGQRWVCLFADDLNPTSTGVYRRLGFQPNHSAQMWRMEM